MLKGKSVSLSGFVLLIVCLLPLILPFENPAIALLISSALFIFNLLIARQKHLLTLAVVFVAIVLLPFAGGGKLKIKGTIDGKRINFDKTAKYGTHTLILGYTHYSMKISRKELALIPLSVEGIRVNAERFSSGVKFTAKGSTLFLPFPHKYRFKVKKNRKRSSYF